MRSYHLSRISSLVVTAGCLALVGAGAAAQQTLATLDDLTAEFDERFRCGQRVTLNVRAPSEASFQGNRSSLQRLLGGARAALGFQCGDEEIRQINVVGWVGRQAVFHGHLRAEERWVLAEGEDPDHSLFGDVLPPAGELPRDAPRGLAEQSVGATSPNLGRGSMSGDPDTGSIAELQQLLARQGYDPGPIDGDWGQKTARALAAYQNDRGLASATDWRQALDDLRRMSPATPGLLPVTERVAAPVPSAHGTPAAPSFKVLRGPAGSEIIEIPMPQDFKPIHLIGLNGLPVTGYPVNEGELNPERWPKADAAAWEVDTTFGRLFDALALRAQPRRLAQLTEAERFASRHLDDQAFGLFFRRSSIDLTRIKVKTELRCNLGSNRCQFGIDEFERQDLYKEFLTRYAQPLAQSLPTTPFEFLLVDKVVLGEYDRAADGFPLKSRSGQPGWVSLRSLRSPYIAVPEAVEVPQALPMTPDEARALLGRLSRQSRHDGSSQRIRHLYFGLRLEVTGFQADRNGQPRAEIRPLTIGLFEDPFFKHQIHEYPVLHEDATPDPTGFEPRTTGPARLNRLNANLAVLKYHPEFLGDERLEEIVEGQIRTEQRRWRNIEEHAASEQGRLDDRPALLYEWQPLRTSDPDLAEVLLKNILIAEDSDWSLLSEPLLSYSWKDVFVFDRTAIIGQDPRVLVRGLTPVMAKLLSTAAGLTPTSYFFTVNLPEVEYIFDREVVVLKKKGDRQGEKPLMDVLKVSFDPEDTKVPYRMPDSLRSAAIYNVEVGPIDDNVRNTAYESWRSAFNRLRPPLLALDRVVDFDELAAPTSDESRWLNARYARVNIEVTGSEVGSEYRDKKAVAVSVLVARVTAVDILDNRGEVIASLPPDTLTGSVQRIADAEAAKRAEEERAKQEQARIAQLVSARDAMMAECESKPLGGEMLACIEEACERILTCRKENCLAHRLLQGPAESCRARVDSARSSAEADKIAKKTQTAVELKMRQLFCGQQARMLGFRPEDEEHREFVEACLLQPVYGPHGPKILSLQLGARYSDEAHQREVGIYDHSARNAQNRRAKDAEEARPFTSAIMYYNVDGDDIVAVGKLWQRGNGYEGDVIAEIGRRVFFEMADEASKEAVLGKLRDTYGGPVWSENDSFLWVFADDGSPKQDALVERCVALVEILREPDWASGATPKKGPMPMGAPFTLPSTINRAQLKNAESCGAVLIARVSDEGDGQHWDLSLTLFNPGWIASRPGPVFAEEREPRTKVRF